MLTEGQDLPQPTSSGVLLGVSFGPQTLLEKSSNSTSSYHQPQTPRHLSPWGPPLPPLRPSLASSPSLLPPFSAFMSYVGASVCVTWWRELSPVLVHVSVPLPQHSACWVFPLQKPS